MELTGFAGHLVGWVILLTAYAIFGLGLFCMWTWFIFDVLWKYASAYGKGYNLFIKFIYQRKAFKKYLEKTNP